MALVAENFVCDEDKQAYEHIVSWQQSGDAKELIKTKNIKERDPLFNSFLTLFVSHPTVRELLKNRPHDNYANVSIPTADEVTAEADDKANEPEVAYLAWKDSFEQALGLFSGHIIEHSIHKTPSTLVFWFDAFPQFVVKMRVKNGYRLGFYDAEGKMCCAVPGCSVSEFDFPVQEVSRVLCASEVQSYAIEKGYSNIVVPTTLLFIFPGSEDELLNDESLFVVQDRFVYSSDEQKELLGLLKKAMLSFILNQGFDRSNSYELLLANFLDVVKNCGLWDFSLRSCNFILSCDENKNPTIVLLDLERPAFGGGNPLYFFHKNTAEVASSARAGVENLAKMLLADV